MKKVPRFWLWLLPAASGLAVFVLWYGVKMTFQVSDWLLPTPLQILHAGWQEKTRLFQAALSTAVGALGGFTTARSGFPSPLTSQIATENGLAWVT